MASSPLLAGAQALLSPCLLHHELYKLLKGQRHCGEPFEREGFEPLRAINDQPRAGLRRQVQGHLLAGQSVADIIVSPIDAHRAIAPHRAHKMQAITDLQPAIRMDHLRDRWQLRQAWKSGARWTIATTASLMGTLKVVVLLELLRHGSPLPPAPRKLDR